MPLDAPFIWQGDRVTDMEGVGLALLPEGSRPPTCLKFFYTPGNPYRLRGAMLDLWQSFSQKVIAIGRVIFDPKTHTLEGQTSVSLTDKETALLALLCAHPNKYLQRPEILKSLWGYGESVDTNTLETHVYRLRQKLRQADASCAPLITQGDGYVLALN